MSGSFSLARQTSLTTAQALCQTMATLRRAQSTPAFQINNDSNYNNNNNNISSRRGSTSRRNDNVNNNKNNSNSKSKSTNNNNNNNNHINNTTTMKTTTTTTLSLSEMENTETATEAEEEEQLSQSQSASPFQFQSHSHSQQQQENQQCSTNETDYNDDEMQERGEQQQQQQLQQKQQQQQQQPDLRFGCAHYKRRAMFVTPCCNKFYKCRFCHDENESHHFDRKTLTELICSECNTRQKVQERCEKCNVRFGKYTCLICNLFDDCDKKQYHCDACGICRIGGAENFFHCQVCNMCLPIQLQIEGHRCVENVSRSHCPVCLGDIHTSRIPCHIPDCGHLLHKMCFDQLLNSGHYTCPTCQTSLIDMTTLWEYLDVQALSMTIPKKYENQKIHIFCNDCHKTSKTKFHFIGLKCIYCGAYNTTQDVKRRRSVVTDEPTSA